MCPHRVALLVPTVNAVVNAEPPLSFRVWLPVCLGAVQELKVCMGSNAAESYAGLP